MNINGNRELDVAELDLVVGGDDKNYKLCPDGTTAGGGPGLYPKQVECAVPLQTVIDAFLGGFERGKGGGGRPA